jgi:hypothetical protein
MVGSMGKLIKFLVAVLVLWAAWHVGISYYHFYVFQDAVEEMARLSGGDPDDGLAAQAARLAAESRLPLTADDIHVRKDSGQVVVEASYVDRVEVLPRYRYPFAHALRVRVFILAGLPPARR